MFQDLDSTLTVLLDDLGAPADVRAADVSFETPGKDYSPDTATINLFLFNIEENRELRDPVPTIEQTGGMFRRKFPPMRVNCSYLVTAWSPQTGENKVEEEHRLLGLTLAWLGSFPTIPDAFLQGGLATQLYPLPSLVAQMNGRPTTSEFWSALEIAPRPSFTLLVTVTLDLLHEVDEGPPVDTRHLRLGLKDESSLAPAFIAGTETDSYSIGGTVTNAADSTPVPAATVTIDELPGWSATTNDAGQYRFDRIPPGNYTLRATEPVVGDGQRNVQVTDNVLSGYDLTLA